MTRYLTIALECLVSYLRVERIRKKLEKSIRRGFRGPWAKNSKHRARIHISDRVVGKWLSGGGYEAIVEKEIMGGSCVFFVVK